MATIAPGTVVDAERPVFYDLDPHDHPPGNSTLLGFWLYLMSDCLIFAMLFAAWGCTGRAMPAGRPRATCST